MQNELNIDKTQLVQTGRSYDLETIKAVIPHREPFLMIDEVVDVYEDEPGNKNTRHIIAKKNLTGSEYYFAGHFPENPVMPGVIMIETLAQAGAFGLYDYKEHGPNYQMLFLGCDKVRFRTVARPGDVLTIKVNVVRYSPSRTKMEGTILNQDGKLVCSASFMAASGTIKKPLFTEV